MFRLVVSSSDSAYYMCLITGNFNLSNLEVVFVFLHCEFAALIQLEIINYCSICGRKNYFIREPFKGRKVVFTIKTKVVLLKGRIYPANQEQSEKFKKP